MSQTITVRVTTLKGQVLDNLTVNTTTTVRDLKYHVSSRMHGQQVRDMKLIYKAKPLQKLDDMTLGSLGFQANGTVNQIHMVARCVRDASNVLCCAMLCVSVRACRPIETLRHWSPRQCTLPPAHDLPDVL